MSGASLQLDAPKLAVTVDTEQVFHMISDEQLSAIEAHGGSALFDISLLLLGATIGLMKDFIEAASGIYSGKVVSGLDLIASGTAVATFASGIALLIASRKDRRRLATTIAAIRSRAPQRP